MSCSPHWLRGGPLTSRVTDATASAGEGTGTRVGPPPLPDPGAHDDLHLRPIVARTDAGPVFSLTILLERRPEPTDETIAPLVRQGTLAMEVALVPTGPHTPAFIREARFALRRGTLSLADNVSSGLLPRASLTARLEQPDATDVLASLDGSPSALALDVTMLRRVPSPPATLHLSGSWAKIYDFLAVRKGVFGFRRDMLRGPVDELLQAGVLVASGSAAAPFEAIFDLFMRAAPVVLELDLEGFYVLRDRPSDRFELSIDTTVSEAEESVTTMALPLDRLLGGLLDGLDRNAYIRLVSPDGGGGIGPAPRRVRTLQPDRPRGADGRAPRSDVIVTGGRFHSVAAELRPMHATASPAALVTAGVLTPARLGHSWWVDDTNVDDGDVRPLPIVDDEGTALWHDRVDPDTYWYAPTFEPVLPDPAEAASTSPFAYTFSEAGATSSGKRGLDATMKATLRRRIPDAAAAALEQLGNPSAQPVVPTALSVSFELPFRDEHGTTQTQQFAAGVEQDGDLLVATVALIDDWARLCYGSLAVAGFQSAPARLTVTYSFEAYVPCGAEDLHLAYGGKAATTDVVYAVAPEPVVRQPCFDASRLAYRFPAGEVHLAPEPAAAARARVDGISLLHAEAVPVAVARPQLSAVALAGAFRRTRYASRSIVRQEPVDVVVPCNTYGAFYVQNLPSGPEAVGCRDALKLGETTWRQFEEIPELRDDLYSVHRSLQQPGRFLVVPAAYRIARFAATEGEKAYRPIVFVYSTLDGATPANDRVLFQFVVQPDLAPHARRRLVDRLRAYTAEPVIVYPTELQAETEYHWTIDSALDVEPQAVKFPDSLQITLATDLTGALLVRDVLRTVGVAATAAFALPDGSPKISVAVDLSLTRLTGPWDGGPVDVTMLADTVLLTNRIERPVDVGDLLAYGASGPPTVVAVDATLEPASSRAVAVAAGTAEAVPVTSVPPAPAADLEEIRSFVEDVLINVVFVDLVDHAGHGVSGIEVEARMKSTPDPTLQVPMTGSPAVGQVEFTLPLTTYLADRTLEFRATATPSAGDPVPGAWQTWDLTARGNVVSLIWGETVS